MLVEFIAAIAVGFGSAGVVLLLRKLSGNRLPRTLIPIAAGLGMLGFAIWSEYSWFARTTATIPDGLVTTQTVSRTSWFRPWTYVVPFVSQFAAVDQASIRRNDAVPGIVLIDTYFWARHMPTGRVRLAVDCIGKRQARLGSNVSFSEDGQLENAQWTAIPADDKLLSAACPSTGGQS